MIVILTNFLQLDINSLFLAKKGLTFGDSERFKSKARKSMSLNITSPIIGIYSDDNIISCLSLITLRNSSININKNFK